MEQNSYIWPDAAVLLLNLMGKKDFNASSLFTIECLFFPWSYYYIIFKKKYFFLEKERKKQTEKATLHDMY